MNCFAAMSIRNKLTLIIAAVASAVVLLTTCAYVAAQVYASKLDLIETQANLAKVFGRELAGPLAFEDRRGAISVLEALLEAPGVVGAKIAWPDQSDFVSVGRLDRSGVSDTSGHVFSLGGLHTLQPIALDDQTLGILHVSSTLDKLTSTLSRAGIITLFTISAAMLLALLIANRLQRIVSAPVVELVEITERFSGEDISGSASGDRSKDEISRLTASFHLMFERITERDRKLRLHRDHLEDLVHERTYELQRAAEESRVAQQRAEAASKAKSQFLANMSHEIRTPMNGVLGMCELLRDTELNDHQLRLFDRLSSAGETLLSIINDILDLSKIEAGKLELVQREFDLRENIEGSFQLIADQARNKKLELGCYIAADLPRTVTGDPVRLRQILLNLLSNAVKFTSEGHVSLEARLQGLTAESVRLVIDVEDTGIGIPPTKQSTIFENFAQADEGDTRQYGGTGLGLAIVRHLAEMMNGSVSVQSKPGAGSLFRVSFEWQRERCQFRTDENLPNLADQCVLLVSDHNATVTSLIRYLRDLGVEIVQTVDPLRIESLLQEALDGTVSIAATIVGVTDESLSGADILSRIASTPGLGAIRRIRIATHSSVHGNGDTDNDFSHCRLEAPFSLNKLSEALAGNQRKDQPNTTPPAEDKIVAHVLMAEDNPVNQEVGIGMLDSLGCRVHIVNNGADAVVAFEQALHDRFDVVLMDCQMPVMDGLEATRRIRRLEGDENRTPILALTANAFDDSRAACLAAGMDDMLSKPFSRQALHSLLHRWVCVGVKDKLPEKG